MARTWALRSRRSFPVSGLSGWPLRRCNDHLGPTRRGGGGREPVPAGIRRLALSLFIAPIVGLLAAPTAIAAMNASVSASSQPPDVTNLLIVNTGDVPF